MSVRTCRQVLYSTRDIFIQVDDVICLVLEAESNFVRPRTITSLYRTHLKNGDDAGKLADELNMPVIPSFA